jgi:pyrroloquinoline quinone biosynthesis protein D
VSGPRALIGAASVPALAHGVRLKEDRVRGRTVVLGPEKILFPDPSAIEVLAQCDGCRPLQEIVDALAARHARPPAEVLADVAPFLQGLLDDGWLRAAP